MALPINIEDLLNQRKVESNRIEFKRGWNPTSIYRTIGAFANDFDNLGGGYIIIGVEEENGMAKRPVCGVPVEQQDKIMKEIVQFNALIEPSYAPRVSPEDVDGKTVIVIWVTAGPNRPYTVPADVKAKVKKPTFFIRYGTSSIVAEGEFLDQLRDLAHRVPFDDRGNEAISIDDISPLLLKEHLVKVGSKLAKEDLSRNLEMVLEQMDLTEGAKEKRLIKNVAAMMFCDKPEKFFKTTQVEIVLFPEGREANPDNITEVPPITGPVPSIIQNTLSYLRTNVLKEKIIKQKDDARSLKFVNYPYQALEEAIVNAIYHRDYQVREPVEITIEPDKISILSFAGPDRSISLEDIQEAKSLSSRRYRNRRLGEFLKELGLTEGRATGIPTIQRHLKENGSDRARIKTDEGRTYFKIEIPCHRAFIVQENVKEDIVHKFNNNEYIMNEISKKCAKNVQEMSKKCPRNVQETSRFVLYNFSVCLLRCVNEVTAQVMLAGLDDVSEKQLRRKYLNPLLEMNLIERTIPDSPRNRNQRYKLTAQGEDIVYAKE
ncbi:MAG: putative DNA binding domain-containing protein [Bacteroidales bacterium]|nr:putative DNA binding domain-containing protein [Bacteroidales bacterium]